MVQASLAIESHRCHLRFLDLNSVNFEKIENLKIRKIPGSAKIGPLEAEIKKKVTS